MTISVRSYLVNKTEFRSYLQNKIRPGVYRRIRSSLASSPTPTYPAAKSVLVANSSWSVRRSFRCVAKSRPSPRLGSADCPASSL